MRSFASEQLRKAPGTQQEKAHKLGVNQGTVSRWESGKTSPKTWADRDTCHRVYGIAHASWDVSPGQQPAPTSAAA